MTSQLFEIDSDGFISQQKGREPYEVIREALQNALDTGSDIEVIIDYLSSTVTVKDSYEEGVSNLDELWTLFEGDKRGDPEQRGRFGRGVKELVAASEIVTIRTTGGTVEFDVEERERDVREDETVEVGTEVQATNSNWTNNQLSDIRDFINRIWVPEGIEITVEHRRSDSRYSETFSYKDPDASFEDRLTTVVVDDRGVMREEKRQTTVNILEDEDGGVYEMGIPVTVSEDFSYILDVQQKIPMAEQRDEPKSDYKSDLIQLFLNNCLDLLEFNELSEDWVTDNITSYSVSNGTKDKYISRRHPTRFSIGNVVNSEPTHDELAKNKGYNVITTQTLPHSYTRMLNRRLKSSTDIYNEYEEEVMEEVEPDSDQLQFINYLKDNILPHIEKNISIEVVELEESPETRAKASGNTIKLNVSNRDWKEISPENVGVVLHELAHIRGGNTEHDKEFIHELQDISGLIILNKSKSLF